MRNFLFCLCAGLIGFGCGQRPQYRPLVVTDTTHLAGIVLSDSIMARVVIGQCIVGDYLVGAYLDQDQKIGHLYTKKGEKITDFCSLGKGPGEVVVVTSIYTLPDSSSFCVYDPQQKKLIQWNVDSLLVGNRTPITEKSLPGLPMVVDMAMRADKGMLAIGGTGIISANRTERFFLIGDEDEILGRYGTYPFSEDTIGMKSACMHYSITVSPDRTKMAHGIYFGAILETYDIRDSIRLRNIQYFTEPDFSHDEVGNPTSYDDITFGFGPLCSSDDRIFAAYNGTKDYMRMNGIAEFDWDGELQKFYKTSFRLIQTTYDPVSDAIFATVQTDTGEYQLVRFDLPKE